MAKITNTSNTPLVVGGVEIAPHTSVEIDDAALASARRAKAIIIWFAAGKLVEGEIAAKAEEQKKGKPATSLVKPPLETQPARRGVTPSVTAATVVKKIKDFSKG